MFRATLMMWRREARAIPRKREEADMRAKEPAAFATETFK
jgi:hypothetical protein